MKTYMEYSFYLPFFDLIDDEIEMFLLEELMQQLNIRFDFMELYDQYLSYGEGASSAGKGDAFVFFNKEDKESFILIDLFHDFTDQYNMVQLGVRCKIENDNEKRIKNILNDLHARAEIKSEIQESHDLLKSQIGSENYPKEIRYGDKKYITNIYYKTM
ncbi:hypothetical protein CDO73_01485 [Saccharibacillus sp. O23]|uniref:hypothetical protein n=1 Tax=Saccharibacillus sp. O23 TaxID=2009338 RepID=UPI000B4E51FE|nr:hypothetical protein [Saccharibacillus sp. O23]OWR32309.1 hypothetical protein CDO73_01485 [Saccharibacillus sp. O23]